MILTITNQVFPPMRGRISKSPGSRRALQPLERERTGKGKIDHLLLMIHDRYLCDGNDGNAIMEMQWWQAMMAMISMMAKMAMMEMRETQ